MAPMPHDWKERDDDVAVGAICPMPGNVVMHGDAEKRFKALCEQGSMKKI